LEGIAGCRDDAMAGFEGGLRKCSTQTPRTTGMSQAFDPVTCMPQLSPMAAATRVLKRRLSPRSVVHP
jgi:hypothetical protein